MVTINEKTAAMAAFRVDTARLHTKPQSDEATAASSTPQKLSLRYTDYTHRDNTVVRLGNVSFYLNTMLYIIEVIFFISKNLIFEIIVFNSSKIISSLTDLNCLKLIC